MVTSSNAGTIPTWRTESVRQALKLAISMVLFYWLALTINWDLAKYGAVAIVLVSLDTRGASWEKAIARVTGTTAGILISFVLISAFAQDRWLMLSALGLLLTVIAYFMQVSRHDYAWYVAAFLPLVVWASNYPGFDNTFYFGTFRWLQTTAGVLIYTVVDILLWPRLAGDRVNAKGQLLWTETRDLLSGFRSHLSCTGSPAALAELRATTAGTLADIRTNLRQAVYDTPLIRARYRIWQAWQGYTSDLLNALEMAHYAIDDCSGIQLHRLVPELSTAIRVVDRRIETIEHQWKHLFARNELQLDSELLRPNSWTIAQDEAAKLTDIERAALAYFIAQLQNIEDSSRRVLQSIERIATPQPSAETDDAYGHPVKFHSMPWRRDRFLAAMFPLLAFAVAFMLWILVNPPTGPRVPMMAGILSLALVRTPMNPIPLGLAMLLSLVLAAAPVYWLLMPVISATFSLLGLIFVYSLVFGYLGGINKIFKLGPMMVFVNVADISNSQGYSFQGPVDAALMLLIATAVVAIVYPFFAPLRPERKLMHWMDRFSRGCTRVMSEIAVNSQRERSERIRAFSIVGHASPRNHSSGNRSA